MALAAARSCKNLESSLMGPWYWLELITNRQCQKDRATTPLPENTEIIFSVSSARLLTLISSQAEVWWLQKQPWESTTHAQHSNAPELWSEHSNLL